MVELAPPWWHAAGLTAPVPIALADKGDAASVASRPRPTAPCHPAIQRGSRYPTFEPRENRPGRNLWISSYVGCLETRPRRRCVLGSHGSYRRDAQTLPPLDRTQRCPPAGLHRQRKASRHRSWCEDRQPSPSVDAQGRSFAGPDHQWPAIPYPLCRPELRRLRRMGPTPMARFGWDYRRTRWAPSTPESYDDHSGEKRFPIAIPRSDQR